MLVFCTSSRDLGNEGDEQLSYKRETDLGAKEFTSKVMDIAVGMLNKGKADCITGILRLWL